jgi:uncharacterized membrane protein YcaP (DUF421 family)
MQTKIRILIKRKVVELMSNGQYQDRVAYSEDVNAKDLQARLRELEKEYSPATYNYGSSMLDPMGI